ncbi:MAG: hypothetical protein WC003_14335 [Terrimicrobiaceae bacterium]
MSEWIAGLLFFTGLLGLGGAAWGRQLGTFARGAAFMLLTVPLLSDWIRWSFLVSHSISWGGAVLIMVLISATVLLLRVRRIGWPKWNLRHRWVWLLLAVLIFHLIARLWIFSGSVPNPADDTYGGYKSAALLFSQSWPASHPELPELDFNYYYFAYVWPAGLAAWLGISLHLGWWMTAVVLCSVGSILLGEIFLPYARARWQIPAIALMVTFGSTFSWLIAAAFGLSPKFWGMEYSLLLPKDLYLVTPFFCRAFWMPFALFMSGCLWVVYRFLWSGQLAYPLRVRCWFIWCSVGALAGYCTFLLPAFVLTGVGGWVLLRLLQTRGKALPRLVAQVGGLGIASLLMALPLLLEFLKREGTARTARFTKPIYHWLFAGDHVGNHVFVAGVLAMVLLLFVTANILGVIALFRHGSNRFWQDSHLILVFLLGSAFVMISPLEDMGPKLAVWVVIAGFLLFFRRGGLQSKVLTLVFAASLIGPLLILTNTVRANLALRKMDPVWKYLDNQRAEYPYVYFSMGADARAKRLPWDSVVAYYARVRFLVDPAELDDAGQQFFARKSDMNLLGNRGQRIASLGWDSEKIAVLTSSENGGPAASYRSESFCVLTGEEARKFLGLPVDNPEKPFTLPSQPSLSR